MTRQAFAAVAAGLVFAASTLTSLPASAADQTMRGWQGAYVGANLGYQWSRVRGTPADPSGVTGGVQLGHNWQFGQYVFGGEADIQLSDANDTFASWKFSNPWFGTLRARAGVTMSNLLLYGTVGLAYGSLKAEIIGPGVTESHMAAGWTAGVGVEAALTGNWTARAEYLYVDLGDRTFVLTGAPQSLNSNILRFGVNYHF